MTVAIKPLSTIVTVTPGHPGTPTWMDVDVSSYIPSDAVGVVIHAVNPSNYSINSGFRKKGSTDTIKPLSAATTHLWAIVGVNTSGVFQWYDYNDQFGQNDKFVLYLVGYVSNSSSVMFTNVVDKSPSAIGSWETIDCSVECPNATGIFVEIVKEADGGSAGHVRKAGSTDPSAGLSTTGGINNWTVVGCNSSQEIEGKIGDASVKIYVIGYATAGLAMRDNWVEITPAVKSSWEEVDLSSYITSGAMAIFFFYGSGFNDIGLRKSGSAADIKYDALNALAVISIGSSSIVEVWAEGTSKVFLRGAADVPTFPSGDLTRVTGIIHRYFKNAPDPRQKYSLTCVLGGISVFSASPWSTQPSGRKWPWDRWGAVTAPPWAGDPEFGRLVPPWAGDPEFGRPAPSPPWFPQPPSPAPPDIPEPPDDVFPPIE